MESTKSRYKNLGNKTWAQFKSWFTIENIKKWIIGSSTSRRMFRLYFFVLIIGAVLLYLPISLRAFELEGFNGAAFNLQYVDNQYLIKLPGKTDPHSFNFLDSLFTAFSGFSDTGLSLFSIKEVFSTFGQIVLMFLIQIGGFGIMFFIFLIWKMFKGSDKISINQTLLAQSEKGNTKIGNTDKMLIQSAIFIILIEFVFMIFYWLWFMFVPGFEQQQIGQSLFTKDTATPIYVYHNAGGSFFAAMFHSVSVINNAGFDILGPDSLGAYKNGVHSIFLMASAFQLIIGGIGFPIIYDFLLKFNFQFVLRKFKKIPYICCTWSRNRQHRLSLFTKLSTYSYLIVAIFGILFSFLFECTLLGGGENLLWNEKSGTFGDQSNNTLVEFNKSMSIIFQSLSTRSAGYATFNNDVMNPITKWLNISLMFIGGSASSTAGGIRTSTLAIVFLTITSRLKGSHEVNVFKRRLSKDDILNSFIVFIMAILIVAIGGIVVTTSFNNADTGYTSNADAFTNAIFMCTSAFGTTGLTITNSDLLHDSAKVYLMFLMFVGQLGVSSTILAIRRTRVKDNLFSNLIEEVRIG